MPEYHIGSLSQADRIALSNATEDAPETGGPIFLNPRAWKNSTLIAKESVSKDTRMFTFKLDSDEQSLGLPVGQHLMLRINDPVTDEVIIRAYTPISQDLPNGTVHLLVKIYFSTQTTRSGKMTTAMDLLCMLGGALLSTLQFANISALQLSAKWFPSEVRLASLSTWATAVQPSPGTKSTSRTSA